MKIDIEKLRRSNAITISNIDAKKRYLTVVNRAMLNCHNRKSLALELGSMCEGGVLVVVEGEPDKAIAMYEIKDENNEQN